MAKKKKVENEAIDTYSMEPVKVKDAGGVYPAASGEEPTFVEVHDVVQGDRPIESHRIVILDTETGETVREIPATGGVPSEETMTSMSEAQPSELNPMRKSVKRTDGVAPTMFSKLDRPRHGEIPEVAIHPTTGEEIPLDENGNRKDTPKEDLELAAEVLLKHADKTGVEVTETGGSEQEADELKRMSIICYTEESVDDVPKQRTELLKELGFVLNTKDGIGVFERFTRKSDGITLDMTPILCASIPSIEVHTLSADDFITKVNEFSKPILWTKYINSPQRSVAHPHTGNEVLIDENGNLKDVPVEELETAAETLLKHADGPGGIVDSSEVNKEDAEFSFDPESIGHVTIDDEEHFACGHKGEVVYIPKKHSSHEGFGIVMPMWLAELKHLV